MPNESTPAHPGETPYSDRAAELRATLVDRLRADGRITSPAVEAAFRTVAREDFLPAEVPLDLAYAVDNPVVTKRDEDGVAISSVSAAYIQARMLEQADLRPGMSVLEVGSGGLNAALIAELVGPNRQVVSVDIEPEVTELATTQLARAGYADRVTVLQADAWHGLPDEGPFDAIIVTAGAPDVAPAWLDQLTGGGVLVVPLIMNGITRTLGFRREGDHLTSSSAEVAGFVPMRGVAEPITRLVFLPDPNGKLVTLRFDSRVPTEMGERGSILATTRSQMWSGVTIAPQTSFADLRSTLLRLTWPT